ncbi:permease-like cell division protein FtsX [Fodinicola acaciae]|uniref:permease-like cell division protein FtsX n=1 Tax=Fodinicola acaciae TaxID=2681555 RepID=UPI0013D44809|nr:permease-like cell division protein FtsX [Fodinicola acaciae]
MRAKFVLSEVGVGLFRNVTMTIAMVLTTAISLALLGAGGLIYNQVGEMQDYFYTRLEVSIFLKDGVTPEQRSTLESALKSDALVENSIHETKADAYSRFREQFKDSPELVANVRPDALPESYRVKLKDPAKYQAVADKYKTFAGVDQVVDQKRLVERLFNVLDTFRNAALLVAFVQGIAALLLIGNTIQVAAYSRRREVSVMRLVGASNWYIQLPFVLEAAMAGLAGAVVGWLTLLGAKFLLVDKLLDSGTFVGVIPTWDMLSMINILGIMVLVGIVLASVAGWFTLRFQIKY